MKKFPVTSKSGIQYKVKIGRSVALSTIWVCKLYKPLTIKGKNILFYKVDTQAYGADWEDDFIGISTHCVRKYEKNNLIDKESRNRVKRNEETFNNWDGQC